MLVVNDGVCGRRDGSTDGAVQQLQTPHIQTNRQLVRGQLWLREKLLRT